MTEAMCYNLVKCAVFNGLVLCRDILSLPYEPTTGQHSRYGIVFLEVKVCN